MTRIKAHNPAKVVTGGDSSRKLPVGTAATTVAQPTRRATKYIPGPAGQTEFDIGRDDWHQVTLNAIVEFRNSTIGSGGTADERLYVAFKKADGTWNANGSTLRTYESRAVLDRTNYSTVSTLDGRKNDWINLCFGGNDAYNVHSPYLQMSLVLTRMYDDYLLMESKMIYKATNDKFCEIESLFQFDASTANQGIQKLIFDGTLSHARIGLEGSITVV